MEHRRDDTGGSVEVAQSFLSPVPSLKRGTLFHDSWDKGAPLR